jgi:drug/metabolite transporter (DMT)-like permease
MPPDAEHYVFFRDQQTQHSSCYYLSLAPAVRNGSRKLLRLKRTRDTFCRVRRWGSFLLVLSLVSVPWHARALSVAFSTLKGTQARRWLCLSTLGWARKDQPIQFSLRAAEDDFSKASIDPPIPGAPLASDSDESIIQQTWQPSSSTSVLLLNLVAVLWGTQHAVIKSVVDSSAQFGSILEPSIGLAAPFTLVRFFLAALLTLSNTPTIWSNNDDETGQFVKDSLQIGFGGATSSSFPMVWRYGAEMGLYMFLGFAFQAIGLEYTTAQRSGFLLYLNVKFVPFLALALYRRRIRTNTWISAVAAFLGTGMLAYGGNGGHDISTMSWVGDAWSIAAALASALFILRLETASTKVSNCAELNSACLWVVTMLSAVWTIASASVCRAGPSDIAGLPESIVTISNQVRYLLVGHPWSFLYLSGVTTAFANWIQTKAQRYISAERASVIYAMDPGE